ncbi:MAG TPA: asparaginase [Gemmatimonadaceae bacterium]|nr:asparaginase [Gemmatimonadaceae bacterium]
MATRGPILESRHRVHAAIADSRGELIGSAGDPSVVTAWRSCAKPMQVASFVAAGVPDAVGWGDNELALACASHAGEPEHVAVAAQMLESIGLEEGDLACGPHEPLSKRGSKLLRDSGLHPTRLHNNCSGKHAAMLAHAVRAGDGALGYQRAEHAVQRAALASVAQWTGVPAHRVLVAVDGCGVTTFGLPLDAMAAAFARFAAAAERGEEIPSRVLGAMRGRPFLVGGTDRFDTVILEETDGSVIAKVGAEGMHSVAVPSRGLGIAIKVEDGSQRAQHMAVIRLLQLLRVLPEELSGRLAAFARTPIVNTRGETVGELAPLA